MYWCVNALGGVFRGCQGYTRVSGKEGVINKEHRIGSAFAIYIDVFRLSNHDQPFKAPLTTDHPTGSQLARYKLPIDNTHKARYTA